jgi:predicted RNA-binding Zn ribbon-like protein
MRRDDPDPRPLLGEPLPLDLLNTHWIQAEVLQDLLDTVAGTTIWLRSADVAPAYKPRRVTEAHRHALRLTRDAIQHIAEQPGDPAARAVFNEVLSHGHRTRRLDPAGPASSVTIDDNAWLVPWLAAESYLDLLATRRDRIRQCQHPQCVLWYLDTSRSGTRRWCSMAVCGNRTKVQRHHHGHSPTTDRADPAH